MYLVSDIGESRFYSQSPNKYFWWVNCFDGPVQSFDSCGAGFAYLFVPDREKLTPPVPGMTGEINLYGLPWDRIAKDAEEITGQTISSFKYTWTGTGILHCSLLIL